MDTDRVGIWGHSGGGFASTRAILEYPDFMMLQFQVLVIMTTEIMKLTGVKSGKGC